MATRRVHVHTMMFRVQIDADAADALPDFPGSMSSDPDDPDCDPPETGIGILFGPVIEAGHTAIVEALAREDPDDKLHASVWHGAAPFVKTIDIPVLDDDTEPF